MEHLVGTTDAALVSWPAGKKKPKTRQATNLAAIGALDGAFWGMPFGLIFFIPFIGLAVGALTGALSGHFRDYGIVESRPDGKVGTWTVGGRSVEVTESTDLDEDNGPLKIGTCAEVDIDAGKAEGIEREPAGRGNYERCCHLSQPPAARDAAELLYPRPGGSRFRYFSRCGARPVLSQAEQLLEQVDERA